MFKKIEANMKKNSNGVNTPKRFLNSRYSFILALVLGMALAVSVSVWATSVGTNVSVTGTMTVSSATASSTVTRALGVGTSTPAMMLSIGGAGGTATGHVYLTGGLGIGIATTTAGSVELTGSVLFGDAAGDLVMSNAANWVFNNAGTTTIPSANAVAWAFATSTANIPFLRFDTTNTRIGISTTTPGATLSVGGGGNIYALGGLGVGLATTTAGAIQNSGNALFGDAAGDLVMSNAASWVFNNQGTSTIPSANTAAWAFATSTANIPFFRFDTSNYRLGVGTSAPATTLSVGGDGHIYALGGLGVGLATTTAGAIENSGNVLFGDAAADLVMSNAASWVFNNQGTTTIPSANTAAWAFATSTANVPFFRFNTSSYRVGIGTTTPGATLSVGGEGNIYALGGLGVGLATTTAGAIENSGNVLFGDAAGDLVMSNAAVWIRNNAGTTTIPSTNVNSLAYATTTSGAFVRFDTSNTRVGISSSTPGATLAVGGDGTAIIMGGATSTLSLQSTGTGQKGGCIELESSEGGGTTFHLIATTTGLVVFLSGSCR